MLKRDENFNKRHGSFRSIIETLFASLGNTFKRFHPCTNVKITNHKIFNLQIKFAFLLMNFKYFVDKFKSEKVFSTLPYTIKMWMLSEFDYPSDPSPLNHLLNLDCDNEHPLQKAKSIAQQQEIEFKSLFNFDNLTLSSDEDTDLDDDSTSNNKVNKRKKPYSSYSSSSSSSSFQLQQNTTTIMNTE